MNLSPPPLLSSSYWAEVARRSEHGAATSRVELWHQRPAHFVLRAHQHLCPVPVCCTKAALPATSSLQGQPNHGYTWNRLYFRFIRSKPQCLTSLPVCFPVFFSSENFSASHIFNFFLWFLLLQLFKAVTFEVGQENKVRSLNWTTHQHFFLHHCLRATEKWRQHLLLQAPRTRAVKNVRRHACSSLIKICRDYPQFILVNVLTLYQASPSMTPTDSVNDTDHVYSIMVNSGWGLDVHWPIKHRAYRWACVSVRSIDVSIFSSPALFWHVLQPCEETALLQHHVVTHGEMRSDGVAGAHQ